MCLHLPPSFVALFSPPGSWVWTRLLLLISLPPRIGCWVWEQRVEDDSESPVHLSSFFIWHGFSQALKHYRLHDQIEQETHIHTPTRVYKLVHPTPTQGKFLTLDNNYSQWSPRWWSFYGIEIKLSVSYDTFVCGLEYYMGTCCRPWCSELA